MADEISARNSVERALRLGDVQSVLQDASGDTASPYLVLECARAIPTWTPPSSRVLQVFRLRIVGGQGADTVRGMFATVLPTLAPAEFGAALYLRSSWVLPTGPYESHSSFPELRAGDIASHIRRYAAARSRFHVDYLEIAKGASNEYMRDDRFPDGALRILDQCRFEGAAEEIVTRMFQALRHRQVFSTLEFLDVALAPGPIWLPRAAWRLAYRSLMRGVDADVVAVPSAVLCIRRYLWVVRLSRALERVGCGGRSVKEGICMRLGKPGTGKWFLTGQMALDE